MAAKPPQPLPCIPASAEILAITERQIAEDRNVLDAITQSVGSSEACFANVLKPLVENENSQSGERAVIAMLRYAAPDLDTQHVVEKAEKMWNEYTSERDRRADLYLLVKAVQENGEDGLDLESQKLLDRMMMRYAECGHGVLEGDGIRQFLDTEERIENLCVEFHRNRREIDSGLWFTDEEIAGIPERILNQIPQGPDGKRYFSNRKKYWAIMRFADNPETRRRMLISHCQKLPENVPIFRQIFHLRDENARRLGYKNHAALKISRRIAGSTEWIDNFLQRLLDAMLPHNKEVFDRMEAKRNEHVKTQNEQGPNVSISHLATEDCEKLMPWDIGYYRRLVEEEANVDRAAFMEYFPLGPTVDAMLDLFSACLQLRFTRMPEGEVRGATWHEDVEVWSVWDDRPQAAGAFIGYLYTDILERPNKFKGCQCVNIQPGYLKNDGSRVYPATILMCSFAGPRPPATRCCYLGHGEVVTLFHELGHGIHDLVSRTKYARFHGYNVPIELGEGIGRLLENWCWLKDELKAMSCHYTRVDPKYMEAWKESNPGKSVPPEKIPDDLLEKRLSWRKFDALHSHSYELIHSLFDMALHNPTSHEELLNLDEVKLWLDLFERINFYRFPEPSWLHADNYILLSGYEAGFYSYLYASVFGADLFEEVFAKDPRSQETWDRFRQAILEPGGSGDELAMLEGFLGRPVDANALLRRLEV